MTKPHLIVRKRVERVGKLKVPGDIDVLVVDPKKLRLGILECKDFATARMPVLATWHIRSRKVPLLTPA